MNTEFIRNSSANELLTIAFLLNLFVCFPDEESWIELNSRELFTKTAFKSETAWQASSWNFQLATSRFMR